jgi:hypothetical protein
MSQRAAFVIVLSCLLLIETAEAQGLRFLKPSDREKTPSSAGRRGEGTLKHSVPLHEIQSGGPPKDGIPSIDEPVFVATKAADAWLEDREPVIRFRRAEDVRAYPLQILMWHEIVNDTVGGVPVAITFCPLCYTAIAFERRAGGRVLDFGTTGNLRRSNLVMYDRQTETWWQQATGEAIVGSLTGRQLEFLPAAIVSWKEFKLKHPKGRVLSRKTGHKRAYGRNPYPGYEEIFRRFDRSTGPVRMDSLPPRTRIVAVERKSESKAYPLETLRSRPVVNDGVGGDAVVLFWTPGTASAMDTRSVAGGRDVGTVEVFSRNLDGSELSFSHESGRIQDDQTRSTWNRTGQAVAGPLAGRRLEPVIHVHYFWFAWFQFRPETLIYRP